MRILLYCILTFSFLKPRTQPLFEQIAFNYFQKIIAPSENIKEMIYVTDSLAQYGAPFDWPGCLKIYSSNDLQTVNASGKQKISIAQIENFKVTKVKNKVNCYVVKSIDMANGNHVVNVAFLHNHQGTIYYIELDT